MKYKGIIFDLDGVICSTDEYHYQAWKALADRLGIAFDRNKNNLLRGVSRMKSLEILLGEQGGCFSDSAKEEMAEEKNSLYRRLLGTMSPASLDREVRITLDRIRASGMRMAIGSSSRNTRYILNRIDLEHFFDAVADGNCISRSKPDPEVFLKASDMLGLSPGDCLVVEDARSGVEAAAEGGFDCAAMGDAREDCRAKYHLAAFSDLQQILLQA